MKCKILFFVLVSALCCTGCGGKKPVPGADARQIVGEPGIQKFEVALNELIVQPFPDPSAWIPTGGSVGYRNVMEHREYITESIGVRP
jgi:hypothetical protein